MPDLLLFLDIEPSTPEESGFPVTIAWTDREGHIHHALVQPDDDWVDWEESGFAHAEVSWEHLVEQGLSCKDVMRRLNQDLGGETVWVDGLDFDEAWLERLAEAAGASLTFELAPFARCPARTGTGDWYQQREQILLEAGLEPFRAEHNVLAMLRASGFGD
ncbi:MAG: hypothetical protein D6758_09620 [Gammaproteobacteria bacterium]|nr:MAG: hypothetical protein D6758_09620 [Gammaproteobacteria bacterium]